MTIINKISQKELSQRKLETYNKYNKIIQWGRRDPVAFCSRIMGIELLDIQKYAIYNSWFRDFNLWLESRNAGKALALDTKIPTPNGFTTMGEIKVGDMIFNELGKPTKVIYTSPIFYNHKCYEIEFEDGEKIVADEDHLWDVQTDNIKNKIKYYNNKGIFNISGVNNLGYMTVKTSSMVNDYIRRRNDNKGNVYKYRIPNNQSVNYSHKDLPIHPYVLGLWLGDGSSNKSQITCHKNDVNEIVGYIKKCGYDCDLYFPSDGFNPPNIFINGKTKRGFLNPFMKKLRALELNGNKHIPDIYLYSSIEQRMELLMGLMDTDGTCTKNGECSFSQKDYNLIKQFSILLSSLGIKHGISKRTKNKNGKIYVWYNVFFFTDKTKPCFKMKRRYNRLQDVLHCRHQHKTIISIKEVISVPTKCIQVDSKNKLYLCGEHFTVTHNTTKLAIYPMIRSLLIPYHVTYYIGNSGELSPINIVIY